VANSLTKRWLIPDPPPAEVEAALAEFPPVFRRVLYNRGVTDGPSAGSFLNASAEQASPFLLSGMRAAVDRILWAVDHGEKIAVYGDYDVDGVTATALLYEVLTALGADACWHIPNRFDEGYGLNNEAITLLAEQNVDLIVTVDCGIRSPVEAEHARGLGLDMIISDHHQPGAELPAAAAIVNPRLESDPYPDKDLSGVGLAYKIAQALLSQRLVAGLACEDWLDLVALGTVSDVVPLRGENRALVRAGLAKLRASRRQGIVSLAGAAGVDLRQLSATDVGFKLGPRLNAAGRIESAEAALNLLLERDVMVAGPLAQRLDQKNRERQALTREAQEKAALMAAGGADSHILFAFSPEFSSGIVGLVASRLVESHYRPAVVGQIENDTARASCRSIPEFHITHALDRCRDLLVRHGGHSVAAGFTVQLDRLEELQRRLAEIAREELADKELVPTLRADSDLDLSRVTPSEVGRLMGYLDLLQPTGQDNHEASFVSRRLRVIRSRTVGADKKHLKLTIGAGRSSWDAIAFGFGGWAEEMPEEIDLLYNFERNAYNGVVSLQLNVRDIKPAL
jgi:single-stranded-DNA-specific exonuclease